ncbi:GPI anchor biosynthesis protein Gpi7 [Schizosaccharomyces japonicus yFS275]|uniref:GPI ethanolamine phosphate transferase 2 n=1 Tax=Schizosaccharomyces japonicus (strain yFS275 / FY16936) TaxID=402676 RepID=B6K2Q7_SCHJY|nr:GPI anchor biosynthesis protein Gpi7 [Schizosaccharomyces japonicus yFS275]EEB07438.1 GPI anchor biosynthesis protein Gpi7 [Schizosaccharomyces japonicus yFS275]
MFLARAFGCLLGLAGLICFIGSFFPFRVASTGFAERDANMPTAAVQRLVFIMIDSMRSDFMFAEDSPMSFMKQLIQNSSHALAFSSYARVPTVTMPRLKALTTGSIPNFLDTLLNIAESDASSLSAQDHWIRQLVSYNKSIEFYGDNTWLKLFPNMFTAYDGTSSFFVSDYETVDTNVTRHLGHILATDKEGKLPWDAVIMHYLGVDHIGHLHGPKSPLMPDKLREMDRVIEEVYLSLQELDHSTNTHSMMVVCGDHGMNELGNHGGSSAGETSAAMTLLFPSYDLEHTNIMIPIEQRANPYSIYRTIEQSDLVPTLSLLLGIPIAKNSIGVIVPEVLKLWDEQEQEKVLYHNLKQLKALTSTANDLWPPLHSANQVLLEQLYNLQEQLSSSASSYKLKTMILGLVLLFLSTVTWAGFALYHDYSSLLSVLPIVAGSAICMFSSSFVEEEQVFWYFCAGTLATLQFLSLNSVPRNIVHLVALSILIRWNQTGQKHADLPGLVDDILVGRPYLALLLCFLPIYIVCKRSYSFLVAAAGVCVYVLKSLQLYPAFSIGLIANTTLQVNVARLCFTLLIAAILLSRRRRVFLQSLRVFLLLQTPANNFILYVLYDILHSTIPQTSSTYSFLLRFVYEQMSFFTSGNSNSLSSIDLMNAYNGLSSYRVFPVGMLLFYSVFSSPLWWTLYEIQAKQTKPMLFALFSTACLFFLCTSCTILRNHLFIWSVFCPKLIYQVIWSTLYLLNRTILTVTL